MPPTKAAAMVVEEANQDDKGLTDSKFIYDYDGFSSNYELTDGQTLQILAALELMTQTGKEIIDSDLFRINMPMIDEVSTIMWQDSTIIQYSHSARQTNIEMQDKSFSTIKQLNAWREHV